MKQGSPTVPLPTQPCPTHVAAAVSVSWPLLRSGFVPITSWRLNKLGPGSTFLNVVPLIAGWSRKKKWKALLIRGINDRFYFYCAWKRTETNVIRVAAITKRGTGPEMFQCGVNWPVGAVTWECWNTPDHRWSPCNITRSPYMDLRLSEV